MRPRNRLAYPYHERLERRWYVEACYLECPTAVSKERADDRQIMKSKRDRQVP